MNNKQLKKEMVEDGTYSNLKKKNRENYKKTGKSIQAEILEKAYNEDCLREFMEEVEIKKYFTEEKAKEYNINCEKLKASIEMLNAEKQQRKRLRNQILFWFEKEDIILIFATWTYNDEALKLKQKTRIEKIERLLKKCDFVLDYALNIDYGKENEREHMHGLIVINKKLFIPEYKSKNSRIITNLPIEYKYGFTTYEEIRHTEEDCKKVANYIEKLTNHALKKKQIRIRTKKGSLYQEFKKKQQEKKAYKKRHDDLIFSNFIRK